MPIQIQKGYRIPIIIVLGIIFGLIIYALFLFLADEQKTPSKAEQNGQELIERGVDKETRARKEKDAATRRADSLQALLDVKPTKEIVYVNTAKKINIVDAYNEYKLDSLLTNYKYIPITDKGATPITKEGTR